MPEDPSDCADGCSDGLDDMTLKLDSDPIVWGHEASLGVLSDKERPVVAVDGPAVWTPEFIVIGGGVARDGKEKDI